MSRKSATSSQQETALECDHVGPRPNQTDRLQYLTSDL